MEDTVWRSPQLLAGLGAAWYCSRVPAWRVGDSVEQDQLPAAALGGVEEREFASSARVPPLSRRWSVVQSWAREQEAKIQQGHKVDPRAGRVTMGEWHAKWWAARVVEDETRRGDDAQFRLRILPYWRDWRLADIGRLDVQAWVRHMEKAGDGRHAIRRSYNLLASMLGDAVLEGVIPVSPCVRR